MQDLIKEFDFLQHKHTKIENPIKMIGVSLEFYFNENESSKGCHIARKIKSISNKAYFSVLICDENNQELEKRDKLTNVLKRENWTKATVDIKQDIARTIDTINNWKRNKITIKSYQYAPYATICFINDNIYYTPNMVYEKKRPIHHKNDNYENINPNFTFCIQRHSPYGSKLEELFDRTWGDTDTHIISQSPKSS